MLFLLSVMLCRSRHSPRILLGRYRQNRGGRGWLTMWRFWAVWLRNRKSDTHKEAHPWRTSTSPCRCRAKTRTRASERLCARSGRFLPAVRCFFLRQHFRALWADLWPVAAQRGSLIVWVYEADLTIRWTNADDPEDVLEVTLHAIGTNDGGPPAVVFQRFAAA